MDSPLDENCIGSFENGKSYGNNKQVRTDEKQGNCYWYVN